MHAAEWQLLISPRELQKFFFCLHFSVIKMGTFVLCTAHSRCKRLDAAGRRSGEGWSPSIYSTSVETGQSVPSAVMV